MTYNELINRFTIYDNPPIKNGYDRHHIVPVSEQTEPDNRQIYVTPAQHMWLHIMYDREHGTKTAKKFTAICNKPAEYFDCWEKCLAYSYTLQKKKELGKKNLIETMKTSEYRQKLSEAKKGKKLPPRSEDYRQKQSDSQKGKKLSDETKKKISDSLKGENNPMYGKHFSEESRKRISESKKGKKNIHAIGNTNVTGRHHYNNGVISVMAYSCPEGFVPGRLYQRRTI